VRPLLFLRRGGHQFGLALLVPSDFIVLSREYVEVVLVRVWELAGLVD
jgi:hypothetical protein